MASTTTGDYPPSHFNAPNIYQYVVPANGECSGVDVLDNGGGGGFLRRPSFFQSSDYSPPQQQRYFGSVAVRPASAYFTPYQSVYYEAQPPAVLLAAAPNVFSAAGPVYENTRDGLPPSSAAGPVVSAGSSKSRSSASTSRSPTNDLYCEIEVACSSRERCAFGNDVEYIFVSYLQDNPVGFGDGMFQDRRLFHAKHNHASLVPLVGLLRAEDFEGGGGGGGSSENNWSMQSSLRSKTSPPGEKGGALDTSTSTNLPPSDDDARPTTAAERSPAVRGRRYERQLREEEQRQRQLEEAEQRQPRPTEDLTLADFVQAEQNKQNRRRRNRSGKGERKSLRSCNCIDGFAPRKQDTLLLRDFLACLASRTLPTQNLG